MKTMPYIPIKYKFIFTLTVATLWMMLSIWLSQPWLSDLSHHIGAPAAYFLIGFIAIIPGYRDWET